MKLLVVGAGGHAKVVVDAAKAAYIDIAGIVGVAGDPDFVQDVPVTHDASALDAHTFIIAVGDNATRAKMFAEYLERGLTPLSVIHPTATVATSASVGAGTFLAAGTIVNPDARIGDNVIINTAATVDHDCVVESHCHLGPNVSLCGGVTVREGALLGVGSCAIGGTQVGAWSVTGAGAAITDDVPAHSLCVGVPARPIRDLGSGS